MAELKLDFDTQALSRGFVNTEKAFIIASENTLNIMAAVSRKNAVKNVHSDFINRNNFTERSIQFEKASSQTISGLVSKTGALERAAYMKKQETGGDRVPGGSAKNVAIPTTTARGGSRSNPIMTGNRFTKMRYAGYSRKKVPTTRKARTVRRAAIAYESGKLLRLTSGIYKVTSFNKDTGQFKTQLIYSTRRRKTKIKSTPWLNPATEKPVKDAQFIFNGQIYKLLKKDII